MRKSLFSMLLLMFAGCISVQVPLFAPPIPLEEVTVQDSDSSDKILLLDVDGIITYAPKTGILSSSESQVSYLKERLTKARRDIKIKAVVLRVNSPGGGVTASDIMYNELKNFRSETGIPVVACFMDVAASGGYYISMAADKIVCHPTCVTGSIGVIAQLATMEKMLEKIGIEPVTVKSGKLKDMGTPLRVPTDEEKALMQDLVKSMFERFFKVVQDGRKMDTVKLRAIADGRVFDANQALAAGLVDSIGYLDDAIKLACEMSGTTEADVVMYERPGDFRSNIYSAEAKSWDSLITDSLLTRLGARFYYIWVPGR